MKIRNLNSIGEKKLFILLQPYTYNPTKSFTKACKITKWLLDKYQIPVLSPILHTHHFDLFWKSKEVILDNQFYYDWDFKLYDNLKFEAIFLFTEDWNSSKGCKIEMKWVKERNLEWYLIIE